MLLYFIKSKIISDNLSEISGNYSIFDITCSKTNMVYVMPMPNNKYKWRPNDNGSLTNLRFDLEAEKWLLAFRKANTKHRPRDISVFDADFKAIKLFLSIPLVFIFLLFLIPITIIKLVFNFNIKIFPGDPPTGKILSDKEKFYLRINEIKRKHSNHNRALPPDMNEQELQDLVDYVRKENAKAKIH